MARRVALVTVVLATLLASIAPLRNYDLFWHLATGRWIVEHRALPLHDPFAVASDRTEWINGEWLFEVLAYSVRNLKLLSILRGVLAAAIFGIAFAFSRSDWRLSLPLTAIAFAGAAPLLDFRPSAFAVLFVAAAIVLAERKATIAYAVLTILWINIHPSALLAPVIAALLSRTIAMPVVSAAALLVNPFGWKAIAAPIELTRYASSGQFVNAEWLPSAPLTFPLLYLCVLIGIAVFALNWRPHLLRIAAFGIFAYLAIAHVRNQGLFFAAFPLLVAPAVAWKARWGEVVAAVVFVFSVLTTSHGLGVMKERFPIEAVARLQSTGLRGNIYNPDQFGGYLIWSFYPERRTLTDGRNELYRAYIPEYAKARGDSRAWHALLRKYRIDLAVEEYRDPLPVIDARTGQRTLMPAYLAYFPKKDWALLGYDDVAMVFARRAAFDAETLRKWEVQFTSSVGEQ